MPNTAIWVEPSYTKTPWYDELVNGIRSKMNVRSAPLLITENPPEEIDSSLLLVVVAGETVGWLEMMIEHALNHGLRIVVASSAPMKPTAGVSIVSLDRERDMQLIIHYFYNSGRRRIALWGINPYSPTDRKRIQGYLGATAMLGLPLSEKDIFTHNSNAAECAESFMQHIDRYDAIVAANDLYAIYMLDRLKQRGYRVPEDLFLAAFGNTRLSRLCSPSITTATLNHYELGRQAAKSAAYLLDNPDVSSISVEVTSRCFVRASTAHVPFPTRLPFIARERDPEQHSSYNDTSIHQLAGLETVLNSTDALNLRILKAVTKDTSLSELAEELFVAEGTLSYRLNKLYRRIGVSTRQELSLLLKTYAPLLAQLPDTE